MSVDTLAAEYDANPSKVVTSISKQGGIHFRPHREPDKQGDFIIVKLLQVFPKKILEQYLASKGIDVQVKKGSRKWVAIIPKSKWKEKEEGVATAAELSSVLGKIYGSQSQEAEVSQSQETKIKTWVKPKITLDQKQGQMQTVSTGTTGASDSSSGAWKPGKYTLSSLEVDLRKVLSEARGLVTRK